MKAKQQIDPNAAGDEVKRLLGVDGSADAQLKQSGTRRRVLMLEARSQPRAGRVKGKNQ